MDKIWTAREWDDAFFKAIKERKGMSDYDQPGWCCAMCGGVYGKKSAEYATWHIGTCGVCQRSVEITEPRDFGFLNPLWKKHNANNTKS